MQGLADGYFIIPYTIGGYIAETQINPITTNHEAFTEGEQKAQERIDKILAVKGNQSPREIHKKLGKIMWDKCGMARNEAGLKEALKEIPKLREEFWNTVNVPEDPNGMSPTLEYAGRVADFLEFAEVMVRDALTREESCGGHFREESQTEEGEAKRDDEKFAHVATWEYKGKNQTPERHREELQFENVKLTTRSYK